MAIDTREQIYQMITGEDEGRVCRDIPEEACNDQPGNFFKHVLSLSATKTGDGLIDPKLVLSWLFTALGAPAYLIGFLVPVREAGSLLPQLIIAGSIRNLPFRKWAWAAGSFVQGLAVIGMAIAALTLSGATAGWTIVGLLAIFALARSICSISYKDVLGKTVSKSTRGTATGTAGTIAAVLVLVYGLSLSFGFLQKSIGVIATVLIVAGGLWMVAASVFTTLKEKAGATEGGGNPLEVARKQIAVLGEDSQLVRFIITRALLMATALAPPYFLALAGEAGGRQLGQLGPFVMASALAAITSSFFWGRLADKSSRRVLIYTGIVAAVVLAAAAVFGFLRINALNSAYLLPAIHFVLMISYQGVRLGRSTHLVDMATPETRATYTALSNTIIGFLLVLGGGFGVIAQYFGIPVVLAIFAVMSSAASLVARGLEEVQAE